MSEYPVADAIISILIMVAVAVLAITLEGNRRSVERAECYRTAKAVSDCDPPAWWEEYLRRSVL